MSTKSLVVYNRQKSYDKRDNFCIYPFVNSDEEIWVNWVQYLSEDDEKLTDFQCLKIPEVKEILDILVQNNFLEQSTQDGKSFFRLIRN